MITTTIKSEWYEKKRKLKDTFVFLENSDLDYKVDEKSLMLENLRIILGKSKAEMLKIFELI